MEKNINHFVRDTSQVTRGMKRCVENVQNIRGLELIMYKSKDIMIKEIEEYFGRSASFLKDKPLKLVKEYWTTIQRAKNVGLKYGT